MTTRTHRHRSRTHHRVLVALAFGAGLLAGSVATLATDSADAHTPTRASCWDQARAANTASDTPSRDQLVQLAGDCIAGIAPHATMHACASGGKLPLVPAHVRVKGVRATMHQRQVITRVLNTGRSFRAHRGAPIRHATRNVQLAAIVGITQESTSTNLPYGDGTSVGVLQLISDHGTVAWRMVVENSAGWFYRGTTKVRTRGVAPAVITQSVQRSANRDGRAVWRYHQWLPEARRTYAAFVSVCAPRWR